jgi:hypothetical protein
MSRGNTKRVNRNKKANKLDKRIEADKEKFLEKLKEMPIIQVAASNVGVHRSTYYRWYNEDPDFQERADEALEAGIGFVNDMMESMLIKLAKEGKVAPIIFWLKNHSRQYMEIHRYEHFHKHEFEEGVLTEERMREIDKCTQAFYESDDEEDVLESDYIHKD